MSGPSSGTPDVSSPEVSSSAAITPQHEPVATGEDLGARKAPPTTATAHAQSDAAGGAREVQSASSRERAVPLERIEIHGLDLASLKEGTVRLVMPLHPGSKFVIPSQLKPIQMKVLASTVASLTVRIGRPDGAPRITEAKVE